MLGIFLMTMVLGLGVTITTPNNGNSVTIITDNTTNLSDLYDVSISTPSNDQLLQFNSTTNSWEAHTVSGIADTNTWNTSEEMQDAVGATFNGTLIYDDTNNKIYINLSSIPHTTDTDTWNTTEEMQDATGAMANGTLIYDDTNNVFYVNLSAMPSTDTNTWNTTEEMQDATGAMANGTLIYDDANNILYINLSALPSGTDLWNTTEEMQDAVGGGFDITLNYSDAIDLLGLNRTWVDNLITGKGYLLQSNKTFNGNYTTTTDFCIIGGNCLSVSGASETDPYWSNNFTLYNTSWSQDTTYTAGSNLTLTSTTFSLNVTGVKQWLDTVYQAIGSYLSNIVEDTTPQLGGDLDLNTHNITNGTTQARIYHNGTGWVIIG